MALEIDAMHPRKHNFIPCRPLTQLRPKAPLSYPSMKGTLACSWIAPLIEVTGLLTDLNVHSHIQAATNMTGQ